MPREFDPTPERSEESIAAEQAALEIGEKLEAAAQEDKERKLQSLDESNELIGGKFRSLSLSLFSLSLSLKAYQELEKKQSQEPEEEPVEEQEEAVEETPEEVNTTEASLTRAAEEYAKG